MGGGGAANTGGGAGGADRWLCAGGADRAAVPGALRPRLPLQRDPERARRGLRPLPAAHRPPGARRRRRPRPVRPPVPPPRTADSRRRRLRVLPPGSSRGCRSGAPAGRGKPRQAALRLIIAGGVSRSRGTPRCLPGLRLAAELPWSSSELPKSLGLSLVKAAKLSL